VRNSGLKPEGPRSIRGLGEGKAGRVNRVNLR
jgi:hypothetical protein